MGAGSPLAADIKCRAVGQPVIEGAPTDPVGGFQHHHVGDSSLHQPVRGHQPRQPGPDDRHVVVCGSRPSNVGSHRFRLLGNLLAQEVADVLDRLLALGQDGGVTLKAMDHLGPDFKFDLDAGCLRALREARRVVQ